jgi:hypothetical protein
MVQDQFELMGWYRCPKAASSGLWRRWWLATAVALALVTAASPVPAQGTRGAEVIIRLRLSGDSAILPPIRSCLVDKLAQMPDVKVATTPTVVARFIVDLIAAKTAGDNISAALVVVQTFPMDEFRPRIKEGEDAKALLNNIRYFTLLRLHELLPDQTESALCERIATDLGQKVLSAEYTERDD